MHGASLPLRMASSTAAALLLPSSSSSDDDAKPPTPTEASPTEAPPQLERDYNVTMNALARAGDIDQVLHLFAELKRIAPAPPSVLCYNTLINACAAAGRVQEAHDAFGEMLAAGVAPNASSFNILVKLLAWHSAQFDLAYKAILRMRGLGVEPNVGTYSTLITGLCRAGRVGEAWGVLEWMLEENCRPMVHTYTPIVQGYCHEGRVEEAKKLMAMMEHIGCTPNVITYNVFIRALCDAARFDEVKEVLAESKSKDWKPNVVTYNTYMNGLCKKGMAKEALEQLDVMLGEGFDPTAYTLSILFNCLCHDSSKAMKLLEMSRKMNWYVDVVGYNTIMSRLCDIGKWRTVLKLSTDMLKKGVRPNTRTFNIVIHSLCVGEKASVARSLVGCQGFAANVVTYNTLIHWFYSQGNSSEVHLMMSEMRVAKIAPDEITYTIIVDRLCRERMFGKAMRCFLESLESGLSRDLIAVLINKLVQSRRIHEILDLFKGMEDEGFSLDYFIFDLTIRSFCRIGFCHHRESFDLCVILDKMLGRKQSSNL